MVGGEMGLLTGDSSSLYSGGSDGSCTRTLPKICLVIIGFIKIVVLDVLLHRIDRNYN